MTDGSLFKVGAFVAHSGDLLDVKVECDALSDDDWVGLARLAARILPPFGAVVGIPRGGWKFADVLSAYTTAGPVLVADDVLTTGASMLRVMETHSVHEPAIGIVAFARGPLPSNVRAVWKLGDK